MVNIFSIHAEHFEVHVEHFSNTCWTFYRITGWKFARCTPNIFLIQGEQCVLHILTSFHKCHDIFKTRRKISFRIFLKCHDPFFNGTKHFFQLRGCFFPRKLKIFIQMICIYFKYLNKILHFYEWINILFKCHGHFFELCECFLNIVSLKFNTAWAY